MNNRIKKKKLKQKDSAYYTNSDLRFAVRNNLSCIIIKHIEFKVREELMKCFENYILYGERRSNTKPIGLT